MSNNTQQPDSGSFLTGLGLGLLGGAVGYFLFATDKGENVRKKLAQEWQKADALKAGELLEQVAPDNSLVSTVKEFFSHILEQAKHEQAALEEQKDKKKAKKKKKLFKGAV